MIDVELQMQMEWKRLSIRSKIDTHRAIKPIDYEKYGVAGGVYTTQCGEGVNVDEFYKEIERLTLRTHELLIEGIKTGSDAKVQLYNHQLLVLYRALTGYLDDEVIIPIYRLRGILDGCTAEDYLDLLEMYEEEKPAPCGRLYDMFRPLTISMRQACL